MNAITNMPSFLSEDEIERRAPAVFTKNHQMTDRYVQLPTIDVVKAFMDADYFPVDAGQDKPTRRDPRFVAHRVIMRHIDDLGKKAAVDETIMQIVMLNSHNGRTKLRLNAGLFRFVCANGLVVGDATYQQHARHDSSIQQLVSEFIKMIGENGPKINEHIERWRKIALSPAKQSEFARRAITLRWGDASPFDADTVLGARRSADAGEDFWRIFNRVQENCTKGGLEGKSANGRAVKSRDLNALQVNTDFNRSLWMEGEKFISEIA